MTRTLAELKREAGRLGVKPSRFTGPGGKEARRDWIGSLQSYYLQKKYPDGNIPWGLKKRLEMQSPMLGYLFSNLKEEIQKDVFDGSNWVFERKYNGVRMMLFFGPDSSFQAFSRNLSMTDYLPVEYTDKVKISYRTPEGESLIFDTEATCDDKNIDTTPYTKGVVTETELTAVAALFSISTEASLKLQEKHRVDYNVFDLIHFKRDLFHNLYSERRARLENVFGFIFEGQYDNMVLSEAVRSNRREYLEKVLSNGGEGVMAKRLDSVYTPTESRTPRGWIKIKRSMKDSIQRLGLGDTIDAFVTGFDRGDEGSGWEDLVGSLTLSIYLVDDKGNERIHPIARCSNIPLEDRKNITIFENGEVKLHPSVYDMVFEIDGQDVSARAFRLTHPRIIRRRPDKTRLECIMMESQLKSFVR